jgi:hypothetical protein
VKKRGDKNPLKVFVILYYYQPGPSGMPSPELGAGSPFPSPWTPVPFGPLGESNPLPSGMPSPAFGAGPMPSAIAFPASPIIPITKHASSTIFFIYNLLGYSYFLFI